MTECVSLKNSRVVLRMIKAIIIGVGHVMINHTRSELAPRSLTANRTAVEASLLIAIFFQRHMLQVIYQHRLR